MQSLIVLKVVFIVAAAVIALVLTVATHREHYQPYDRVRSEYAMPRVFGYGLAALFTLMSLNELGHLIALVRGAGQ